MYYYTIVQNQNDSSQNVTAVTCLIISLKLQREPRTGGGVASVFFIWMLSVHSEQQQDEEVKWQQEVVYLGGVGLQHGHQGD